MTQQDDTQQPRGDADSLVRLLTGDLRTGVIWTPVADPSDVSWKIPQHLDVLELPSNDVLDPEQLASALSEWAPFSTLECLVLLPPVDGFVNTEHVFAHKSAVAMESLSSVVSPSVSLICLTTSQTVGQISPGSPMANVLGHRDSDEVSAIGPAVAHRRPSVVVELHPGLLSNGFDLENHLVLLKLDPSEQVRRTIFLRSDSDTGAPEVAEELAQLMSGAIRTANGFAIDSPFSLDRGMLPAVLDPARSKRSNEASELGELVRFGDLFDIQSPMPFSLEPLHESFDGAIPVVTVHALRNGEIDVSSIDTWVNPGQHAELVDGDLVLSGVTKFLGNRLWRYRSTEGQMVAGHFTIVARPRRNLTDSTIRVLMRFIASSRFALQLDSVQGREFEVDVAQLIEALVPMPDRALLEAFESVEAGEVQFRHWQGEAEDLIRASMEAPDLGRARRRLIAEGSLLRQRAEAAAMLDDIGHRVATRYPLPVAYRWRSALAARGGANDLTAVLHANEVLHAYLGVLAITSARLAGIEMSALTDIRKRLAPRRSGLGLGDWRALLQQFAELKAVRRLPDTHPIVEIRGFRADPSVVDSADRLWQLRNDVAHLREFGPGELKRLTTEAWSDLDNLYRAAAFVTDYPLIRVIETKWNSYAAENAVQYRQLSGDNPIVPVQAMTVLDNTIETESLYLLDRHQELHLLRPLLIGGECPSCGHWSTFHPDRITGDGAVEYKSFEHGHSARPEDVQRGLIAVGLIEADLP